MHCPNCNSLAIVKFGFYKSRGADEKKIQRYRCKGCKRTFSDQTDALTFGEHKPLATQSVMQLLMCGVSQRRCAKVLKLHPITVARKLCRLGMRAIQHNLAVGPLPHTTTVLFDEMETFEHSKCKPVSIPIAVEEGTRKILAIDAVSMPAKGKLSKIAKRRYGRRANHRRRGLLDLLARVREVAPALTRLKSDKCPQYPILVTKVFNSAVAHETHKGRRGCVVGQGELKRGGFDPLFSLNHTCAMIRDNIKRMSRRTWTTTKRIDRLKYLLSIYAWIHNQLLDGADWAVQMA